MKSLSTAILLSLSLIGLSCVSQRRHLAEVTERKECLQREQSLREQLESYNTRLAFKDGQIQSLKEEVDRLDRRNQELQNELNRIINDATTHQEEMEMALQARSADLNQKEELIDALQHAILQRDRSLTGMLDSIEIALKQYTADELSIEMLEGRLYVALSDRLLFASGSYMLNQRGREALGKLAAALRNNTDAHVLVEGHTDDRPIQTGCIRDNWDLSVLRATSVVRILTQEYGLPARQITAAGRGSSFPKATNETASGRSLNRRIEVIIEPKLDEIFSIINAETLGY